MSVFLWPVPGFYRVTSGFGKRVINGVEGFHRGIDIGRNLNPPLPVDGAVIVAPADGEVVGCGSGHASMGNWIEIAHADGWLSRYMHNSVNSVIVGQVVGAGNLIGLVGNTGRSTGPHLHFELIKDGMHVDPFSVLALG